MITNYRRVVTTLSPIIATPILLLILLVNLTLAAPTAPVLDLNGAEPGINSSATFTEDEGYEPIVNTTGLTVNNGEKGTLTAAKAVLTNRPDDKDESLWADPGSTGLDIKYTSSNGELNIKGNASVESYQQVLRTLSYNNLSQSPDITDRVVEVTVSDGSEISAKAISTVAIQAVNDAPVLDNTGDMVMTPINEDDQNSSGNSVTGIIKSAETNGEDRITDVDENSPEGMAIIEAVSSNGVWQYSLDAGKTWQPFVSVSNTSATLLDGQSRIRFVPNSNFSGSANFLFRAWDQSGGRPNGSTGVDVSINGGTTAFSVASEMVTIQILPVNDLPEVDLNGPEPGFDHSAQAFEGGVPTNIAAPTATITDNDNQQLAKLVVTLDNRPDGAAEVLAAPVIGSIRVTAYDPATGMLVLNGPDTLSNFQQALRQTTYANNSPNPSTVTRTVTVVANDGTNDSLPRTSTIRVSLTNSAPVLDSAAVLTLPAIPEDTLQPPGQRISQILAAAGDPITDLDEASLEGLAVIDAGSTSGQWQYTLSDPPADQAAWLPVGTVSNTAALLLPDTAWLRYVPVPDFAGKSDPLTIRAWDRTSGNNGQRGVDVSTNGGATAFSTAINMITTDITAVNDLPLIEGLPDAPLLYIEDSGALPLTGASLTVTDVDSPLLASATARLVNPQDGDAESLLVTTEGTNIVASYEDGVVEMTGAASPFAYQQVLRTLVYINTSQDPDASQRIIELSVADNQGSRPPSTIFVQVQPVNDLPEVDLNGVSSGLNFSTAYFINRGPVPLTAESMTVSDVDNTTLRSATVRITNLLDDQREILTANVSGTAITRQFDHATGVLKLTGADSIANYQKVLRTVTYNNTSVAPNRTTRHIEFIVYDGLTTHSEPSITSLAIQEAPAVRFYLPIALQVRNRPEEPNNNCKQALGVDLNQTNQFRAEDKDDWFYFDLPQEMNLTVELRNFTPREGQIIVWAERQPGIDCSSNLVIVKNNGSDAMDKIVSMGRQPAKRYYIWIINDGPTNGTTPYSLHVRATP